MTLFVLVFPFLTYFDFLSTVQVGTVRKTAATLRCFSLSAYLAEPLPFKDLQTPVACRKRISLPPPKKRWSLVKIINVVSVKKEEETQPCVEMCDHFKLGTSLETAVTL